eukprot:TRINITY_DN36214_c0_g1_i1.p3 TRINITY_DN36214_c0_g1~~TRINITY_DN36214_c0_g1_i1.p3  ORF type:complete len:138 (-),score=19.27 TRINITY_DN36214_c0_g1_i1:89-472(-)
MCIRDRYQRRVHGDSIPLTFLLADNNDEDGQGNQFEKFCEAFREYSEKSRNVWLIKPGENSNRGNGIYLFNALSVARTHWVKLKQTRTLIIQKYIENPLLYKQRKCDFRCYMLVTGVNGFFKGFLVQ